MFVHLTFIFFTVSTLSSPPSCRSSAPKAPFKRTRCLLTGANPVITLFPSSTYLHVNSCTELICIDHLLHSRGCFGFKVIVLEEFLPFPAGKCYTADLKQQVWPFLVFPDILPETIRGGTLPAAIPTILHH